MRGMKRWIIMGMAGVWGTLAAGPARAALTASAQETVRMDIRLAVEELNTVRDDIAAQRRVELAALHAMEQEVAALRRERDRLRRIGAETDAEVRHQQRRVEAWKEEARYLRLALLEYRRGMETRISAADAQALAPTLESVDAALGEDAGPDRVLHAGRVLLERAGELHGQRFGMMRVPGEALDDAGQLHEGVFLTWGPVAIFHASDGSVNGLVSWTEEGAMPVVYTALSRTDKAAIATLAKGNAASVAVDVSHGRALMVRQARRTPVEFLRAGGFTMIPLLFIGALSLFLAVLRAIALSTATVRDQGKIDRIVAALRAGEMTEARQSASVLGRPLREMVGPIIEHARASAEMLEELAHEKILTIVPRMERHLGTLAVFGGVAPLLGLLGTVTGMIHTFQRLTLFGTGDARQLSGGISEALITTVTGLAIAIPVLLVHAWLSRRVRALIGSLEDTAVEVIHAVKD